MLTPHKHFALCGAGPSWTLKSHARLEQPNSGKEGLIPVLAVWRKRKLVPPLSKTGVGNLECCFTPMSESAPAYAEEGIW